MQKKKVTDGLKIRIPMNLKRARRSEWVPGIEEELSKLLAIGESYEEETSKARANKDLTPSGQFKVQEHAASVALEKIARFEKATVGVLRSRLAGFNEQIGKRARIERPSDPAERLAYELRLAEIRGELRKLDDLEVQAIYLGSSDPIVIDAIETAPPVIVKKNGAGALSTLRPFIDPNRKTAAILARAEAEAPELAEEMRDIGWFIEMYESSINTLRPAILAEVPSAAPAEGIAVS